MQKMDGVLMSARALTVLISVLGTASVCGCATTAKAPASRSQGEVAPVFQAHQVIPPQLVRGSNYRITERVPVEEYAYVFTIKSDFGDIVA